MFFAFSIQRCFDFQSSFSFFRIVEKLDFEKLLHFSFFLNPLRLLHSECCQMFRMFEFQCNCIFSHIKFRGLLRFEVFRYSFFFLQVALLQNVPLNFQNFDVFLSFSKKSRKLLPFQNFSKYVRGFRIFNNFMYLWHFRKSYFENLCNFRILRDPSCFLHVVVLIFRIFDCLCFFVLRKNEVSKTSAFSNFAETRLFGIL